MEIIRFITAGSVDDGKSTLIGRLLHDTGNIMSDILQTISTNADINLAHITDGLRNERTQGITIDIGYKYFTSTNRKYIIADAPGHFEYTKNLVSGASGIDLIIILIDAEHGITAQTRAHTLVASFLHIKHIVVAINKMDKVNFEEEVFLKIKNDYLQLTAKLNLHNIHFIPVSALNGDNVINLSENMNWYKGNTLLHFIENCPIDKLTKADSLRMAVQYSVGTDNNQTMCFGELSGTLCIDEDVIIYPANIPAKVYKLVHGYNEVSQINTSANINVILYGAPDIKRGCVIAKKENGPKCGTLFIARLCWLDSEKPLSLNKEYIIRNNIIEAKGCITAISYKIDIYSFEEYYDESPLEVNQFAGVHISTENDIVFDSFSTLPENARGIIIDPETYNTVGAFIIN